MLFSAEKYKLTFSKNGCHHVAAFSITFVVGRSLCRAAIDLCLVFFVGVKVFLYLFLVERTKLLAKKRTPLLFIRHNPHSFNCLYQSNNPLARPTRNQEGQHSHRHYCHCPVVCGYCLMRGPANYPPQFTPSRSHLGCSGIIEHLDYPG